MAGFTIYSYISTLGLPAAVCSAETYRMKQNQKTKSL